MTVFQSTRPARGATVRGSLRRGATNISIHAPREGRDYGGLRVVLHVHKISIHAPREGRDPGIAGLTRKDMVFQSTRPARGATTFWGCFMKLEDISIHAPREGRDDLLGLLYEVGGHFNPRAPRGARQIARSLAKTHKHFNPRAPRGARQVVDSNCALSSNISIHAPREGRDRSRTSR